MNVALVKKNKPVIVVLDRQTRQNLACPNSFKIETTNKNIAHNKNALLVLPLSHLSKHTSALDAFKAVFLQADVNTNAILGKVKTTKEMAKIYIFDQWQDLNKILQAWHDGVQDNTIAVAWVEDNYLIVKSCSLQQYSISFKVIPALTKISVAERADFQIHKYGNYLYWPKYDVHLDIETIKYACDKKYRNAKDIEKITYYKNYGQAIAQLRKQKGLTQKHIEKLSGISARQLYRVEKGGQKLTIKLLEKLSKAHKLNLNDYLNAVAKLAQTNPLSMDL